MDFLDFFYPFAKAEANNAQNRLAKLQADTSYDGLINRRNALSQLYGGPDGTKAPDGSAINWNPLQAPSGNTQFMTDPQQPPVDQTMNPGMRNAESMTMPSGLLGQGAPPSLLNGGPQDPQAFAQKQRQLLAQADPQAALTAQTAMAYARPQFMPLKEGEAPGTWDPRTQKWTPSLDAEGKPIQGNAKPTDFVRDLIAEGIKPGTPEFTQKMEDKFKKDTYIANLDPIERAKLIAQTNEAIANAEKSRLQATQIKAGMVDQDTLSRMASQYIAGDHTVMAGFGKGTQGAANLTRFNAEVTKQMRDSGATPSQIIASQVNLKAQTAAARTAATRGANVDMAAFELDAFADQALEAAEKVKNRPFVPWNTLENMAAGQMSDPDMAAYLAAMQGARGAYAGVVARNGNPTVDGNHTASNILNGAQDYNAVKATLLQWKREAAGVQKSSKTVQGDIIKSVGGAPGAVPGAPASPAPKGLKFNPATGKIE